MTIEKLSDAITELESDILDRYFIIKQSLDEKKNPRKRTLIKWASLAACLCLIITAGIIILPYIVEPPLEGPYTYYYVGDIVESSLGTVTFENNNTSEGKCTFILEKKTNDPICFAFRGYTILREYIDKDGVALQEVQQYHIITPYGNYKEAANNHIVVDDKLIITVNGENVDTIPMDCGTYEITIDYSQLYDMLDGIRPAVEVIGFKKFVSFVFGDDGIER